jgi:hypothetical protein
MARSMRTLVTDPESFFEEIITFGRVGRAALIPIVAGLAYSLQGIILFPLFGSRSGELSSGIVTFVVGDFAQPLAVWIVFFVSAWAMVKILGGRSLIGDLMKTTGWALTPLIATGVVWTIGRYIALSDVSTEFNIPGTGGFRVESSEIQTHYLSQVAGDPVYLAFRIVGIVFILAAVYLTVLGVKSASSLDLRKSAIATAPAAIFYLAVAAGLIAGL